MGNEKSKQEEPKKEEEEVLLRYHKKKRNHLVGCMKCVREILPVCRDGTDNGINGWSYLCGTCREARHYCIECVSELRVEGSDNVFEHKSGHRLFKEPVDLQVDVTELRKKCNPESAFVSAEALREIFHTYRNRVLLGERDGEDSKDFSWQTYASVYEEANAVFIACRDLFKIRSGVPVEEESTPGEEELTYSLLVGASSRVWYVAYFAMMLYNIPLVPMFGDSTPEQLEYVIEKVKPKVVFISKHIEFSDFDEDTGVVILDDSPLRYHHVRKVKVEKKTKSDHSPSLRRENTKNWNEIVEHGKQLVSNGLDIIVQKHSNNDAIEERRSVKDDEIRLLLSSSGTTGLPKLIIQTEEMIKNSCIPPESGHLTVVLSINPLRQVITLAAKGGRVGIYTSMTHIQSDLQIVRPTLFGSTPAFFIRLYEDFKVELRDRLIAKAKEEKKSSIDDLSRVTVDIVRSQLSEDWVERNALGNRCSVVIIGGAVSSKELQDFIFDSLAAVVIDGYGTTETGGIADSGKILEDVKVILVDSPEYGYLTSDEPYPRGEIVVHTPRMTKGYFRDPEANAAQFVKIGGVKYSKTGDIGRIVEGGEIEVIDRVKSLFKLRNGVFVAPSPIECVYENSPLVQRVFVYGNSSMAFITAAVVVNSSSSEDEESEGEGEEEEVDVPDFQTITPTKIRTDFARLARIHGLKSVHVPRVIIIDEKPWTVEDGLINSAGKPIRAALTRKYKEDLIDACSNLGKPSSSSSLLCENDESGDDTDELGKNNSRIFFENSDLNAGLVRIVLECIPEFDVSMFPNGAITSDTALFDLGADSLAFARMVGSIRKRFSSTLTMPQLMSCDSLGDVQRAMFGDTTSSKKNEKNEKTSSEFWMGEVNAGINELKKMCEGPGIKICDRYSTNKNEDKPLTVLLTGGRGFVGIYLLSELCKRGAKVICVLRRRRCESKYNIDQEQQRSSIQKALKRFSLPPYEGSWTVIDGDISKVDFGISDVDISLREASERIKGSSEFPPHVIIHCAASVGSASPYSTLKHHNVKGSIHALALAYKFGSSFLHISTVGFLPPGLKFLSEEKIVASDRLGQLGSYAQTKWVAERIVLDNDVILPKNRVSVARLGTCFGARETGCANDRDSVIRLIAGLAHEKVFCTGYGSPLPTTFHLAPVDWVSQTIIRDLYDIMVKVKEEKEENIVRVTCLMTRHETSLLEIIEAMKKCGVQIDSIPPEEFRERMASLTEDDNHPLFVFASTLASAGFSSTDDQSSSSSSSSTSRGDQVDSHSNPPPDLTSTIEWMIKEGFIKINSKGDE